MQFAFTNDIYLLFFPSHSSHLLQPLDVGTLGPLGQYYSNKENLWSHAHPYQVISKGVFFPLCQKAWCASLTEKNYKAAFAVTGIDPFHLARVLDLVEKAQPIVAQTLETTFPPPAANPGFPAFHTALPANT